MFEPKLKDEPAPRGLTVTRRFEQSRLEEELYESVYAALLVEKPVVVADDAAWLSPEATEAAREQETSDTVTEAVAA